MSEKRKGPELHPAFDPTKSRDELIAEVADAMDKKLEQTMKIGDAVAFFNERVWEFEEAVEKAFDEYMDYDDAHDDEIEDLKDRLADADYANDQERLAIVAKIENFSVRLAELKLKHDRMNNDVKELKKRGVSLHDAQMQTSAEATEYLRYIQDLLQLAPLTKPVDE